MLYLYDLKFMFPFKKKKKDDFNIPGSVVGMSVNVSSPTVSWAEKMLIGKRNDPLIDAVLILLHEEYYRSSVHLAQLDPGETNAAIKYSGELASLGRLGVRIKEISSEQ